MGGTRAINFFTKNPNLKKCFLLRIQIKNKKMGVGGGGGVCVWREGGGGWRK